MINDVFNRNVDLFTDYNRIPINKIELWNATGDITLTELVDYSDIEKALVIADRGYESFNSMAHIQEKGWFYLICVKDSSGIKQGLDLLKTECFDVDISLKLTRKKTNEVKELLKDKNHYRMVSSTQPFHIWRRAAAKDTGSARILQQ